MSTIEVTFYLPMIGNAAIHTSIDVWEQCVTKMRKPAMSRYLVQALELPPVKVKGAQTGRPPTERAADKGGGGRHS